MSDILVQQVVNALSLGGIYALLALGLALVFSVLGMINFAHGDLMTLAGYVLVFVVATLGLPFAVGALLAALVGAMAAFALERVAFRPVRGASLATMLLTTFAISSILHVLFQNLISPRPVAVPVPGWLTGSTTLGGISLGTVQLVSLLATLGTLTALTLFLRRTDAGIAMRAAAQDFAVARLMGIRAGRVIGLAFAISGAMAAISGLLWVAQRGSVDPLMGFVPVLKAFVAVVIGGLGSLPGAVLGGFVLGALEVGLRSALPDAMLPFREAITLSLVIAILIFRPNGLLGRAEAVR